MIIDELSNTNFYFPLSEGIEKALRYLQEAPINSLPAGKYEIAAAHVYAGIQESITKPLEKGFWEAHRKYIDIHYVLEGVERIGYLPIDRLRTGTYDEEKNLCLFGSEKESVSRAVFFTLLPGTFVIMMPQDAHMPGIAIKEPQPIKKLVIKIALSS